MRITRLLLISRRINYKVAEGSFEPRTQSVAPMAVAGLQVVGGTPAILPSLLYTDASNKGFLINAGEGIQRMILESAGLRIANITDVLTTRFEYNTVASIPGIGLFRRDQLAANLSNPLTIWGTDSVTSFMRTTQLDCFADEVGIDRHIVLKSIDEIKKVGNVSVKKFTLVTSQCFMFYLPPKAEAVNKKKLKEMNIPQKMMATLFKTGTVKLEDGKVVNKSDLLEPSAPVPVFIVVDAQTDDEVEVLLKTDFHGHIEPSKQRLLIMIHFTKQEQFVSKNYKTFIEKFKKIDHLFMCKNPSSRILYDCSQRNATMSSILPMTKLHEPSDMEMTALTNLMKGCDVPLTLSEHLLKYVTFPGRKTPVGWSTGNVLKDKMFNFEGDQANARKVYESFMADKKVLTPAKRQKRSVSCPDITFLGTTSTYSSTFRNVSGILVQCPTSGFTCLLDAGEMTVGQLIRLYGAEKTDEIVSKLNFLYISHIHFDHCGGSMSVAELYHKVNDKPLTILCPVRTLPWFKYLSSVFKVPLNLVPLGKIGQEKELRKELQSEHGVLVDVCPALHTRDSWCVALTSENWKVAYSGDTMPNTQFVEIGKNCDVLIHEATHQSSLAEDAAKKRHSTVSQAIGIGKSMNARFTVLTHFSLRYQKIPPIIHEELPTNVAFAHDFMKISKDSIEQWCESTNIIPLLFPNHYQDMLKQNFYKNFY